MKDMINNKPAATYKKDVEVHASHFITTLETMSVFITPEDTSEEFDAAFALVEMGVAKIVMGDHHDGMWLTRATKSHSRPWSKIKSMVWGKE